MNNYYIKKISNEIRYKISIIFKKYINDIRIKNISIINVEITKNFEIMKIYFLFHNCLDDNIININEKIKLLNKTVSFINKNIYKKVKIKKIPNKTIFIYDNSINKGFNLYKLIKNEIINCD